MSESQSDSLSESSSGSGSSSESGSTESTKLDSIPGHKNIEELYEYTHSNVFVKDIYYVLGFAKNLNLLQTALNDNIFIAYETARFILFEVPLSYKYLKNKLNPDIEFLTNLVFKCPSVIKDIPQHKLTESLCNLAVSLDGLLIEYIDKKYLSINLYKIAFKNNIYAIKYLQEKYYTMLSIEYCESIVREKPDLLEWIPEKFKTYNMCVHAIKHNGYLLKYVPLEYITPELIDNLTQHQIHLALLFIPIYLRTHIMYINAVKYNGSLIKHVPILYIDYDMCVKAVSQNGKALKYIVLYKYDLLNYELCILSLQTYNTMKYIPDEYKSKELQFIATQKYTNALKYCINIDEELCYNASLIDKSACIPDEFLTDTICENMIKLNPYVLLRLPKEKQTTRFFTLACLIQPSILYHTPKSIRTVNFVKNIINQKGYGIEYLPDNELTYELCLHAVTICGSQLPSVPINFIDEDMFIIAMKTTTIHLNEFINCSCEVIEGLLTRLITTCGINEFTLNYLY